MSLQKRIQFIINHAIPSYCIGEKCSMCKKPASHKVEEDHNDCVVHLSNGNSVLRHPYTAYVCCRCFRKIMGSVVTCFKKKGALNG